jgi:uncharacterized protein YegP (UPF0339 family)
VVTTRRPVERVVVTRRPLVFTELEDSDGSWRWQAHRNGRMVGEATGYSTQSNARRAHRELRAAIVAGSIREH